MKFTQDSSDNAILEELGDRLSRYRLNRDLTQEVLAKEAGVSKRTLIRMENGDSVLTDNLIRVLRAHGLLSNFEALVPAPKVSPIQQAKLHGKERQRASSPSDTPSGRDEPWSWGDEE